MNASNSNTNVNEPVVEAGVESAPLTDWVNPPTFASLNADLTATKQSHSVAIGRVKDWRSLMKVDGKYKPQKQTNRSSVQPKLVRKQAEWRYAPLSEPFLSSDKLFDLRASTAPNVTAARQNQLILNWQFRTKIDRVKFIDDYVRAATNEGTVIVRTGWERTVREVEIDVPVYDYYNIDSEEQLQQLLMASEAYQAGATEDMPADVIAAVEFYMDTGTPVYAVESGTEKVTVEEVVVNKPTVDILDPENVFIDPSCLGNIDKANFAVIAFETSKAELEKQTGTYKNLDKVNWDNAGITSDPDFNSGRVDDNFNFQDTPRKRVIAYEYWGFYDIHNTGVLSPIVCTWVGDTIIRMEENPFPDKKIPLVIAQYMPEIRSIYGEADAELLGENQAILGALTRGSIDLMARSANSQTGMPVDYLDQYNLRLYNQGSNYQYNPQADLTGKGIIEHTYPEISQSVLAMMAIQNQEAESMTGVKSFSGGVSGESYGQVAAGIRGALDAASKREMGILRRLANGIKEIGKKIISMNSEFLSEEETINITADEYVTIKRVDLAGDFELIVDISTAEIDQKKSQELAFMLQTMAQTLPFEFTQMMLVEYATLQRMPDLADMIKKHQPEPDPLEEELKQLAVEKERAEVEKLRSEIAFNEARRLAELAKANKLDIDTQQDVDGTQHQRDMEKMGAQAEANQDYKVTEALLRNPKAGEAPVDPLPAIGYNQLTKQNSRVNTPPIIPGNITDRDMLMQEDPRYSLSSKYYDPSLDPASNSGISI